MFNRKLINAIVLLLPTQLGLHFWPVFTRVSGIKVDYLSPTLYLIDLLIILLVVINIPKIVSLLAKHRWATIFLLLFAIINTVLSVSPANTAIWWLRTFVYLLFYLSLKIQKIKWKNIRLPLFLGTITIVGIEIVQFCTQSSINGPLYYLGERQYSQSTSGIGRLELFGLEILRPMSTFSHPNSLAGYLLIVFYLFSQKASPLYYKIIPFVGVILSFSKTAIVTLLFLIYRLKPRLLIFLSLLLTAVQPFLYKTLALCPPLSTRAFFFPYLKNIFPFHLVTGVGLGSFVPFLGRNLPGSFTTPEKLQPIHNLIYLALSEVGLLGAVLVVFASLKQKITVILRRPEILELIAIILFTGTFDHYTWTLPQNKLILILALAIML